MSQTEQLIKSYVPMSEASFLLLVSLTEENHGYGIMQKAAFLTGGRVSLGAGTVYTILNKMENDELIAVLYEEDRRKVYGITPLGREVLRAECGRIGQLAAIAQQAQSPKGAALHAEVVG